MSPSRSAALLALIILTSAASASADPGTCRLWGEVTDGPTATPVAGAVVRVGEVFAVSDELGHYELSVPRDRPVTLELYDTVSDESTEALHQSNLVFDCEERYRPITLVTKARLDQHPMVPNRFGVPWDGPRPVGDNEPESRSIDLREVWRDLRANPDIQGHTLAVLPEVLPPTIAIGRRFATTCVNNPIVRVDHIDLETYAAGVVTAEIGVFRALTDGEEASYECFKTFAIAARSYALWWWANNPTGTPWNGETYQLDDTACNQRYDDGPYPDIILRAVAETEGMVMIDAGTTYEIDKYEYAASCGRNGSLPEHTTEIVPDNIPGVRACTGGGWCGHDNCAAHEDNPNVPGDDKCLVRGICQWGSVERSIAGEDYLSILNHYQPHLDVHTFTLGERPVTTLVGFVRENSIQTGAGIADAQVDLDTGESVATDTDGYYVFDDVTPGVRVVEVSATGFFPTMGNKLVVSGVENWASVAMTPTTESVVDDALEVAGDTGPAPDAEIDATGVVEESDVLLDTPQKKGDSGCCTVVSQRPESGVPVAWLVVFGLLGLVWVRRRS